MKLHVFFMGIWVIRAVLRGMVGKVLRGTVGKVPRGMVGIVPRGTAGGPVGLVELATKNVLLRKHLRGT